MIDFAKAAAHASLVNNHLTVSLHTEGSQRTANLELAQHHYAKLGEALYPRPAVVLPRGFGEPIGYEADMIGAGRGHLLGDR